MLLRYGRPRAPRTRPVFKTAVDHGPSSALSVPPQGPQTGYSPRHDRRYSSGRWRRLAKQIISRDNYICRIVRGCTQRATCADHIIRVEEGTPDSLFFDPRNLRAGCNFHNVARGMIEAAER